MSKGHDAELSISLARVAAKRHYSCSLCDCRSVVEADWQTSFAAPGRKQLMDKFVEIARAGVPSSSLL